MTFEHAVELVGRAVEVAGIAVIVLGSVVATVHAAQRHRRGVRGKDAFRRYRHGIGRAILLGLEFLVAGDIIRTVAVSPTFTTVGVLAVVVLIRTFLSFSLEVELEGRWPWQRRPDGADAGRG
jgi:uncharacterized membrane protein